MRIIRVFPRRTKATPVDPDVRINLEPGLFDECDAVNISVTFTWGLPRAEQLASVWRAVAPVEIGGPATGQASGDFTPGLYLAQGYTITSRGCPNNCWFCQAWRREGATRELPIRDGWNILDDNLLACSEAHVLAVFEMLKRQPQRPVLTGGLEAARITPRIARAMKEVVPWQFFVAYDLPEDLRAIQGAGEILREAGFSRHDSRAYVLCGWRRDTLHAAERRMEEAWRAGFIPYAMPFMGPDGKPPSKAWSDFARLWRRPAIIAARMK